MVDENGMIRVKIMSGFVMEINQLGIVLNTQETHADTHKTHAHKHKAFLMSKQTIHGLLFA